MSLVVGASRQQSYFPLQFVRHPISSGGQVADSSLNYEPMPVLELFGHYQFYAVPHYQRDYSWTDEEVTELMDDLFEAWEKFPDEAYLLGQIIVCPAKDRIPSIAKTIKQWDLIDGQQRCTTLLILLIVASKLIATNQSDKTERSARKRDEVLGGLISIIDEVDDEKEHLRIRTAANGEEYLQRLLRDEDLDSQSSQTQENMFSAIDLIKKRLNTIQVSENSTLAKELRSFIEFVQSKVFIVRLALESNSHALRVFQKVNNRGLQLDDADLIKSYLFEKVSDVEFQDLSLLWNQSSETLRSARLKRLKSMEYLLKTLIGIETGKSISTGNLFTSWSELLNTRDKVKSFAELLPENATYLERISKSQHPKTGAYTDLGFGIHRFKAIQQIEVQIAGTHLNPESYEKLIQVVEDRTMLSLLSEEPPQAFERIIHPWAKKIAALDSNAGIREIIEASQASFTEWDFVRLTNRAFEGVCNLDYRTKLHRDKMRYLIARANRVLQSECKINSYSMTILMQTRDLKNRNNGHGYDLDHIFPQSSQNASAWIQNKELDEELKNSDSRFEKKVHSIGNLTLLNPIDNSYQSDALPWEDTKIRNYAGSDLRINLTQISPTEWQQLQIDVSKLLTNLQTRYKQFDEGKWGEVQIDLRAKMYWELAMKDFKKHLILD